MSLTKTLNKTTTKSKASANKVAVANKLSLDKKEKTEDKDTALLENKKGADTPVKNAASLWSGSVQTSLKIGSPGGKHEKEADAVAEKVMNNSGQSQATMSSAHTISKKEKEEFQPKPIQKKEEEELQPKFIQRKEEEELQTKSVDLKEEEEVQGKLIQRQEEEKESIQAKFIQRQVEDKEESVQTKLVQRQAEEKEEPVQAKLIQKQEEEKEQPVQKKSNGESTNASAGVESGINSTKGQGQSLDSGTQEQMGSSIGADFSNVRVHTDSTAVQMNQDLNSKAFTHGSDIYFNQGNYDTKSKAGKGLLAHELTHTVQQGGVKIQTKPTKKKLSGDLISPKSNKVQQSINRKIIQLSPLSDELKLIWESGDKATFFNRLRNLGQSDLDVFNFINNNLKGDDLWLAKNIFLYGKEINWPIHLRVEREMKGWSDCGGKGEVFNILRSANGASASDKKLNSTLNRLFPPVSDDNWLAINMQKYGLEKNWPINTLIPAPSIKNVKFGGGHSLSSYGGDSKINPVWTPASTDHASAFTKGNSPSLDAKIKVGKKLSVAGIPTISIRVKEGANIKGLSTYTSSANDLLISGLSASVLSNSSEVRNKNYILTWEASVNGATWGPIGTSGQHLVYWLHNAPTTPTLYNYAAKKATDFSAGAANVPAAIRTGLRNTLGYNPADPINTDPLTVFADGVGICTDFGNLLTLLAQSVGFSANTVMFWGGFQSLGKNIWAVTSGSYINLTNVKSPNPAYNPPLNPAGWAFNYHVISRIAGILQDAALDRTGISAQALHGGKIVHYVELAGISLANATKGTAYNHAIVRKDHAVAVTIRDYGSKITTGDFSSVIPIIIPSAATSPVAMPVTWSLPAGGLPAGLVLDSSTGVISGTPTVDGSFTISVKVKAGSTLENNVTLTLLINP